MLGSAVYKLALEEGHIIIGIDCVECYLTHPHFTAKIVDTCSYQPFFDAVRGCDSLIHLAADTGRVATQEVSPLAVGFWLWR